MGKTKKKHLPSAESRKKVVELRASGVTKKEIAKRLKLSLDEMLEIYGKEVKQGWRLLNDSKKPKKDPSKPRITTAERAKDIILLESRFKHGLKQPPANCPIPQEELDKIADQIVKYDASGVPCNGRGSPLFGKKAIAEFKGKIAHHGTPWHHVIESSPEYGKQSIAGTPWDVSNVGWEATIMARRSLVPPALRPYVDHIDLGLTEITEKHKFQTAAQFNIELAQRAVVAFNKLHLSDVPGTPTLADAGADWFREIITIIFGSYDPATKTRMIKELFLLVPKKNNKTTGGALIMLLLLIFNERPNGQAIMCAPVKDVADIAFDAIAGAIRLDPVLSGMLAIKEHKKKIIHRKTEAELEVMTFDPAALTGQKLFAALIDELHVMMKISKADRAIRQIRGGMLPFPEAILIFITTQSEDAPAGVFKAELALARDVRDGKHKPSEMLPILYEFPDAVQRSIDKAWKDPALWDIVTPNAGKSITIPVLVKAFHDAERKGQDELKSWGSQHLNIEIGVAIRSEAWAGASMWEAAYYEKARSLDGLIEACEVIEAGIDGGGLDDLLSISFTGRETGTGRWLVWTKSWVSKIVLERRKSEAQVLQDFHTAGELCIVDEMGEDLEELISLIDKCNKSGLLDKIGLDPYGVGGILDEILALGIEPDRVVGVSQGWKLGGAIKTAERALAERKLAHGGQAIMAYAVGNAKVEPRGNAILITKQASGTAKIDPLMAMFNSIHLIATNPAARSKKFQMLIFGGKSSKAA